MATLWTLAVGTRVEEAGWRAHPPWRIRAPQARPAGYTRRTSIFSQGLAWIAIQLWRGRCWRRLWLADDPWPRIPAGLSICYHDSS